MAIELILQGLCSSKNNTTTYFSVDCLNLFVQLLNSISQDSGVKEMLSKSKKRQYSTPKTNITKDNLPQVIHQWFSQLAVLLNIFYAGYEFAERKNKTNSCGRSKQHVKSVILITNRIHSICNVLGAEKTHNVF